MALINTASVYRPAGKSSGSSKARHGKAGVTVGGIDPAGAPVTKGKGAKPRKAVSGSAQVGPGGRTAAKASRTGQGAPGHGAASQPYPSHGLGATKVGSKAAATGKRVGRTQNLSTGVVAKGRSSIPNY